MLLLSPLTLVGCSTHLNFFPLSIMSKIDSNMAILTMPIYGSDDVIRLPYLYYSL
jgi:hypothetical protein